MRFLSLIFIIFFASACTKKDLLAFKHYQKKNKCEVVSFNANKQDSDDFYVIKTFNRYGVLTHLKTQIRDPYEYVYVYDYDITYTQNRAIFKGSTKVYMWTLDTPPPDEYQEPPDPYGTAPKHADEQVELRDIHDFEVLLDNKTHYPIEVRYVQSQESILKLTYNNKGHLSKLHTNNKRGYESGLEDMTVTTDRNGNILSILTPPFPGEFYTGQQLGVVYRYNERSVSKNRTQYYETPNIVVDPMYSILEILNWGPFQPNLERVHAFIPYSFGDEYLPVQPLIEVDYYDHQYDQQGNLVSYTFNGDFQQAHPYYLKTRTLNRSINWQCGAGNMK